MTENPNIYQPVSPVRERSVVKEVFKEWQKLIKEYKQSSVGVISISEEDSELPLVELKISFFAN